MRIICVTWAKIPLEGAALPLKSVLFCCNTEVKYYFSGVCVGGCDRYV